MIWLLYFKDNPPLNVYIHINIYICIVERIFRACIGVWGVRLFFLLIDSGSSTQGSETINHASCTRLCSPGTSPAAHNLARCVLGRIVWICTIEYIANGTTHTHTHTHTHTNTPWFQSASARPTAVQCCPPLVTRLGDRRRAQEGGWSVGCTLTLSQSSKTVWALNVLKE